MNLCILLGRTTKDPSIRMTADGSQVASFTLAVDTGFGEKKKSNFFEMVAFGKAADSIGRMIRQGTKIIVQSQAQQNVWTDKEGRKHYDVNFVVQSWEFAESKRSGDAPAAPGATTAPTPTTSSDGFMDIPASINEDIPFA